MANLSLILILVLIIRTKCDLIRLEIVNNKHTDKSYQVCGLHRSFALKQNLKYAYQIVYGQELSACDNSLNQSIDYNAILVRIDKDCSYINAFDYVQQNMAGLAIIDSNGPFNLDQNKTKLTIPFVFLPRSKGSELTNFMKNFTENSFTVHLKHGTAKFDWSIVILLCAAILIIVITSLWNLYHFKESLVKKVSTQIQLNQKPKSKFQEFMDKIKYKDYFVSVSFIIIFSFALVGLVVLTYFFYDTMVWIQSIVFATVAANCWFGIGSTIMDKIKFLDCKVPTFDLPFLKFLNFEIRKLIWLGICIAISAVWLGFRQAYWSWILLDILLVSLIYISLSYIVFKSYFLLILFLVLITIYDLVMILILPNHVQKMNQMSSIAFGIRTSFESFHETSKNYNLIDFTRDHKTNYLPFFITIPNISLDKKLCNSFYTYAYTFLGIGDILIPGFGLNYAIVYDKSTKRKIPLYYITNLLACCLGYLVVGLIISFVDEIIPAMLIVSPLMIISSLILAFIKKEIKPFMMGVKIKEYSDNYAKDTVEAF